MTLANPLILLILVPGGWDPTMVFDPKLDTPYVVHEENAEIRKGASDIPYVHHPDRPSVRKWFEDYGKNASIVNGIYVGSLDRLRASQRNLSAIPPNQKRPVDWLTFYAANLNPTLLAPHFVIDSPYFPGHLGASVYSMTLTKIKTIHSKKTDDQETMSDTTLNLIDQYRRTELNKFGSTIGDGTIDGDKYLSLFSSSLRHKKLEKAIKEIMDSLKNTESNSDFLISGKIGMEMLARSYSLCITISYKDPSHWETYEDHFKKQSSLFESLFSDLSKIMEYAEKKDILRSTLIVLMSDRGRSPRLNDRLGKNSWPYSSMLLWGPGIKSGSIGGKTDHFLRGIPIDPIFGNTDGANAVTLETAHVFSAIFTRFNLPVKLLIPDIKPLSTIIESPLRKQ